MKNFLFYIASLAIVALTVFSCTGDPAPAAEPQAFASRKPLFETIAKTTDTLTNADTVIFTVGSFFGPVNYVVQVFADSLSGSTAGTATLQHSAEMSGNDWVDLANPVTVNGVTTRDDITGAILGGRLRLRTISSGTQSTALRTVAIVTEDQP